MAEPIDEMDAAGTTDESALQMSQRMRFVLWNLIGLLGCTDFECARANEAIGEGDKWLAHQATVAHVVLLLHRQ